MTKQRQVYFDHLVSRYKTALQKPHRPDIQTSYADGKVQVMDNNAYRTTKRDIIGHTLQVLDKSKLFLLNGAVVDDLYHMPPEYTDYETATRLPFPVMFFELMDPLEVERIHGEKTRLTAMMVGKSIDADPFYRWAIAQHAEMSGKTFSFLFFYDTMKEFDLPDNVICGSDKLHLVFRPEEFANGTLFETNMLTRPNPPMNVNFYSGMTGLCLNTISYINAHNVTVRREDRQNGGLSGINARRIRHGKKPLPNLKPYYWIDVRQSEARERNREEESKMEYREWVRGAFHRYHTRAGIVRHWVQPYIRGPEDKPWKENRYRILADMLQKGPRL
ncbi:MAG: hypothetical protein J4400_04680 [Candidatus Aenigmarchaeota archaeon]|nr:hypothetical protein [Candidatus Aenigmarchaeota archaeon]